MNPKIRFIKKSGESPQKPNRQSQKYQPTKQPPSIQPSSMQSSSIQSSIQSSSIQSSIQQSSPKKPIRIIKKSEQQAEKQPMKPNNNINQLSAKTSEGKKQQKQPPNSNQSSNKMPAGKPTATKPTQSFLGIPIELIANKTGDDFNQRIYKKDISRQVPLKGRNNNKSVKIPIRTPTCQSLDCIFNYQADAKFYQCTQCNNRQQYTIKEMVFDWRLANLLHEANTFMNKISSVTGKNFFLILSNGVLSILNDATNELFTESDWVQNEWNQQNPEKLCFEMENFMVNQLYGVVKQSVTKYEDLPQEYNKIQELLRGDSASIEQNMMSITSKEQNLYGKIFNKMQNPGTFNYQYDDKTKCSSIAIIFQKQEIPLRKYPIESDPKSNLREKIGRQRLNRVWFMDNVNNIYSFGDKTENLYIYRFYPETETYKEEVYLTHKHLKKFSGICSSAVFVASTSQLIVAHLNVQQQDQRTIYKFKINGTKLILQSEQLKIPLSVLSIKAILGLNQNSQKQKIWYACLSRNNIIKIMTQEYDAEQSQNILQPQFDLQMTLLPVQFSKSIFFYMFLQQESYLGLMSFGRNTEGKLGAQTSFVKLKNREQSLLSSDNLVSFDTTQQVYTVHPSGIVNHQSTRLLVKGKKTQMIAIYNVGNSITAKKITV